jgi:hypothetical protein
LKRDRHDYGSSDAISEMLGQLGATHRRLRSRRIKNVIFAPDSLSYAEDGFVDTLRDQVTNARNLPSSLTDPSRAKDDDMRIRPVSA